MVEIKEEENKIIWTSFEQPHRNKENGPFKWDYSNLKDFEFEKKNYNFSLNILKELVK